MKPVEFHGFQLKIVRGNCGLKSRNFIFWWMADNEEGEETTSRGNEWEVVSLTASAYAAAPGPKQVELNDSDKGDSVGEDKGETSQAMFMSGHFVFPPSQHENLPLEPETTEIHNEQGAEDAVPELVAEEGGRSGAKDDENFSIKGLTVSDEFPGLQFFDDKGNRLPIGGRELEESIYGAEEFSSFDSEASIGGLMIVEENSTNEPIDSDEVVDSDLSRLAKPVDEDVTDGPELPCEAWWKRRAASLYAHAKEANTFWSIFIAAAVMGLVIIGQRWQQERWQVLQLKWQFGINDEFAMSNMREELVCSQMFTSYQGCRGWGRCWAHCLALRMRLSAAPDGVPLSGAPPPQPDIEKDDDENSERMNLEFAICK
ncbi:hypothetical protein LguiA_010399 [Lonicera macranthoides]